VLQNRKLLKCIFWSRGRLPGDINIPLQYRFMVTYLYDKVGKIDLFEQTYFYSPEVVKSLI